MANDLAIPPFATTCPIARMDVAIAQLQKVIIWCNSKARALAMPAGILPQALGLSKAGAEVGAGVPTLEGQSRSK